MRLKYSCNTLILVLYLYELHNSKVSNVRSIFSWLTQDVPTSNNPYTSGWLVGEGAKPPNYVKKHLRLYHYNMCPGVFDNLSG